MALDFNQRNPYARLFKSLLQLYYIYERTYLEKVKKKKKYFDFIVHITRKSKNLVKLN